MSVSCIFSSFFCFSVAFAFHRLPHRFAGNSRGVGDFTKCCHRNNYNFHQKILQKSMRIRLHNEGDKEVDSTKSQRGYSIKLLNTIEELSPQEWNGLLKADSSPFLEYHWIHALEKSGCASETEGWKALHVAVFDSLPNDDSVDEKAAAVNGVPLGQLLAVCPLYVKYNSMGEFIFDHSWADYAERMLGVRYYPKLLSAVPFTPATGSRVLLHPTLLSDAEGFSLSQGIASFISQLAADNGLSSAHVNFMKREEVAPFLAAGYRLRETIQYRWHNFNKATGEKYSDFEDYLSLFKSKRRMQIRRERRAVYEEEGIRVEAIRGDDPRADRQLFQTMFHIYTTTVEKMWGRQYLTPDFFDMLYQAPADFKKNILFIVAYAPKDKPAVPFTDSDPQSEDRNNNDLLNSGDSSSSSSSSTMYTTAGTYTSGSGRGGSSSSSSDERIVAGTINLVKGTHFYGRYWGAFEYIKNLHFEACYYKAIEYCIEHGIEFMEPGAGGGEFKFLRGFDPYIVNSVHAFTSSVLGSAVADFLVQERKKNNATADYLLANSALSVRVPAGTGAQAPAAPFPDQNEETE